MHYTVSPPAAVAPPATVADDSGLGWQAGAPPCLLAVAGDNMAGAMYMACCAYSGVHDLYIPPNYQRCVDFGLCARSSVLGLNAYL